MKTIYACDIKAIRVIWKL